AREENVGTKPCLTRSKPPTSVFRSSKPASAVLRSRRTSWSRSNHKLRSDEPLDREAKPALGDGLRLNACVNMAFLLLVFLVSPRPPDLLQNLNRPRNPQHRFPQFLPLLLQLGEH